MCRAIVEKAGKDLNQFPAKDGIADNMSPLTMMTGRPFPDFNSLTLEFGTYVHIYEDNNPTNTSKSRTTPAITLNQTGSVLGGYFFMSLITGKEVSRQQWTVLPMPDEAILAVEAMAEEEGQPHMTDGMLNFEWRPGVPFKDGEDEDADLNLDDEELVMGDLELIEETQQEEGF